MPINEKNISWVGNNEAESKIFGTNDTEKTTSYGMDKELQTALSEIRTDLDSFSDNEAFALMFSGYAQTINSLADTQETVADDTDWAFKKVEQHFTESFIEEMKIGKKMFFKWWYVMRLRKAWLYYTVIALALALFSIGFVYFLNSVKDISGTAVISWFKELNFGAVNLYYVKWISITLKRSFVPVKNLGRTKFFLQFRVLKSKHLKYRTTGFASLKYRLNSIILYGTNTDLLLFLPT